jgi:hypothetical protein
MRRVAAFRRLFGLLLLTAMITLWARSFQHVDGLQLFDRAGNLHGIASDRGTMLFFTSKIPFGHDKAWSAEPFSVAQSDFRVFDDYLYDKTALKFKWAGVKVCSDAYTLANAYAAGSTTTVATWPFQGLTLPDWLLTAIVGIPTLRSLRGAWVRRRRKARGLCIACGYDLRGGAGRCPECGGLPTMGTKDTKEYKSRAKSCAP